MSGSDDPTLPFCPEPKLFFPFFVEKNWLFTAFIVCYKIKHGGFDFHMHITSLYHPHSVSVK